MKTINMLLGLTSLLVSSIFLGACVSIGSNLHSQLLTDSLAAKSGSRTVQEDLLLDLPTPITKVAVSLKWLDSNHIVYTLPSELDSQKSEIEIIDINTNVRKKIAEGVTPRPSPNGKWVAFVRDVNNKSELWVVQRDGRKAKRLIEFKEKVNPTYTMGFAWSPDSKFLAVNNQQDIPSWEREVQHVDDSSTSAVDADHLSIAPPQSIIEVIEIKSNKRKHIASIDAFVKDISWFPNGQELLFTTERSGFYYSDGQYQTCIKILKIENGTLRNLVTFNNMQQYLEPTSSPDGQKIAFTYDADNPEFNYLLSIGLISISSPNQEASSIVRLTRELKLWRPQWSHDNQKIYALRDYGAYCQIYTIDVNTGHPTQITNAPSHINTYALSPEGTKLAWIGNDAHARKILWVADSNGKNAQNLLNITSAPTDMALSEVREIEWKTIDFPAPMRGLLVLPINYQEGTRYPLIVDIHGGGAGARISLFGGILASTPLEWQLWAAKGYAVFVPEFRSSASFGALAITRDHNQEHDLVNRDIIDIVSGVDALISRGIVDSKKMAVVGFSAGAERANWLTVATHRFQAVVSIDGWADSWYAAGITSWPAFRSYGGSPGQRPEYYQKNSSLFHSRGASTPTLFLMGNPKLGGVDPYDTVRWLYNSLKEQNIETQYIRYPDEGHGFERKANRKDALNRAIKWIDSHLNSK